MQIEIKHFGNLRGRVLLPSSKSICNRALVINYLALLSSNNINKGTFSIDDDVFDNLIPLNVSDCDDTKVMIEWLKHNPSVVDIGAAGTAMRFSTALLSILDSERIITGSERMKERPISVLVNALRDLGATIDYIENENYPPLRIRGKANMRGGDLMLPGNVSSQYVSALLMIGPMLQNGLTLKLTDNIISKPYIDLTIHLMSDYGAVVGWKSDSVIRVEPKKYEYRNFFIESDWSASSYWYSMVALSDDEDAEIVLPGLYANSYQGDSKVVDIFECIGVGTEFFYENNSDGTQNECIRIYKNKNACDRLEYDFISQPDLAQTFVVCCCMLGIPFRFTGLQSLKIKETDRINALRTELLKMGFVVNEEDGSVLYWNGEQTEVQPDFSIETYKDHRMAMAFAPCALRYDRIIINDPGVVSKSYPSFWKDLKKVGFVINEF